MPRLPRSEDRPAFSPERPYAAKRAARIHARGPATDGRKHDRAIHRPEPRHRTASRARRDRCREGRRSRGRDSAISRAGRPRLGCGDRITCSDRSSSTSQMGRTQPRTRGRRAATPGGSMIHAAEPGYQRRSPSSRSPFGLAYGRRSTSGLSPRLCPGELSGVDLRHVPGGQDGDVLLEARCL